MKAYVFIRYGGTCGDRHQTEKLAGGSRNSGLYRWMYSSLGTNHP